MLFKFPSLIVMFSFHCHRHTSGFLEDPSWVWMAPSLELVFQTEEKEVSMVGINSHCSLLPGCWPKGTSCLTVLPSWLSSLINVPFLKFLLLVIVMSVRNITSRLTHVYILYSLNHLTNIYQIPTICMNHILMGMVTHRLICIPWRVYKVQTKSLSSSPQASAMDLLRSWWDIVHCNSCQRNSFSWLPNLSFLYGLEEGLVTYLLPPPS